MPASKIGGEIVTVVTVVPFDIVVVVPLGVKGTNAAIAKITKTKKTTCNMIAISVRVFAVFASLSNVNDLMHREV